MSEVTAHEERQVDDGDIAELQKWARVMEGRLGHATMDARPSHDPIGNAVFDRQTAQEFAEQLFHLHGLKIESIEANPTDPPDCLGILHGHQVAIELTELVDGELIADLRRSAHSSAPMSGAEQFRRSQWSMKRFELEVKKSIKSKSDRYSRSGLCVDFLVIHSDENWLLERDVEVWLRQLYFEKTTSIKNVFLLCNCDPDSDRQGRRSLQTIYKADFGSRK